jgi:signal transduction histidine kinase
MATDGAAPKHGAMALFQRFILIMIPLTLFVFFLGRFYLQKNVNTQFEIIKREQVDHLKHTSGVINTTFETIISDVVFLSRSHEMERYLSREYREASVDLTGDWAEFLSSKEHYDQIRFIDKNGMEKIRIDYFDGSTVTTKGDGLQSKSDRYYFKETMVMTRGDIFVSPLDLNVENGEVERPFKPMIRFATPLFDARGEKKGILVLNYLGSHLIELIRELGTGDAEELMLLNNQGYWLFHDSKPDYEWGFMLGKRAEYRFDKIFPYPWNDIRGSSSGQFVEDIGLLTFDTVRPLDYYYKNSKPHEGHNHLSLQIVKTYSWKLASYISRTVLAEQRQAILDKMLNIIIPLLIVLALISLLLARETLRREKAMLDIISSRDEAQAATLLKDKFVSLVAHDLRSPIANNIGMLKLLEKLEGSTLSDKGKNVIDRIMNTNNSLVALIEELLKISMLQTGKIVPNRYFLDIHDAVENAISKLSYIADKKGIAINNRVRKESMVFADYHMYLEVIQNLLSNAIKFSRSGGEIDIYIPKEKPSLVAVKDTGTGIDKDLLPKLFMHDVRTSMFGTAGEKGTGLGLPYSMDVVRAHGGDIACESEIGKGTVFYVTMPRVNPLVLLVDDTEENIIFYGNLLRKNGIEVMEAQNGGDAMRQLEKQRPHLVVLDIDMSVMGGFDFMVAAKQNPSYSNIPILVLTSDSEKEVRDKAIRLGAEDFINRLTIDFDLMPRVFRLLRSKPKVV